MKNLNEDLSSRSLEIDWEKEMKKGSDRINSLLQEERRPYLEEEIKFFDRIQN